MRKHEMPWHQQQRGMSLLFALMALVVISLASVALVRSVDTSALVIGNLGFKQDANAAAAPAAEQAIKFLIQNNGATLYVDHADLGYYATSRDSMDATGQSTDKGRAVIDWGGTGCSSYASDSYGGVCMKASAEFPVGANMARFVITRLCAMEGDPSGNDCAVSAGGSQTPGGAKAGQDYGYRFLPMKSSSQQYYRVVVRVKGARGTVAFTETIVLI